jgi:hypothetical protein
MFCACPAFSRVFDFTRVVVQVPWRAEVTAFGYNEKNDVHCFSLPEFVDPL